MHLSHSKGLCASESVGTLEAYGIFMWPDTRVGHRSTLACPYNNESIAIRECWHTTQTDSGSVWGPTDVTQCEYKDIRSKGLFLLVQVIYYKEDSMNACSEGPFTVVIILRF
jgi:hypothetical protein